MLTNADKPFEVGEVIDFCDSEYIVLANHGNSGRVRERHCTETIQPFYWVFECVACKRVTAETLQR